MARSQLEIVVVVSPPYMENTLIVRRQDRDDCLVVDPGSRSQEVVEILHKKSLTPSAILLTHGHLDHIEGNETLRRQWPSLPIMIGARDAPMLTNPVLNFSARSARPVTSPPADRLLAEPDRVEAAGLELDVLDIPGHSPGHIVYLLRSETPFLVLGGDVLFQGSIGRCDLPGGSQELLVGGIRKKLFSLPEDTVVYPGHGDPTTVGQEKRTNPFCGDRANPWDA
jgi:glyoxylase-like metal-dependent hydrolase (beta-lactamase superfamily II)